MKATIEKSAREFILNNACSGMFSDELDKMGMREQVISGFFMNYPNGRIFGQVRTLKVEVVETDDENIRLGLEFFESLNPGEIFCVQGCSEFAYFGELMTRLSLRRSLGGIVIGGLTRDGLFTRNIRDLVIFSQGYSAKDIKGRGRVKDTDCDIEIDGINIRTGDWVFGDCDSIVFIPNQHLPELVTRIIKVINNESEIIAAIDAGKSIQNILSKHKEF